MDEKQSKILQALMSNFTIQDAAKSLGISPNTIYITLRDETFAQAYKEARHKAVEHSITILSRASSLAVTRLIETMGNSEEKSSVRLSAAKSILEFAFRGYETEQLVYRVERLEEALKEQIKGNVDDQYD